MIFEQNEDIFLKNVDAELKLFFNPNEKIAVKLHMGEKGNKTHISPGFTKQIVALLKGIGCRPFLFDSPVMYEGSRDTPEKYLKTSEENGFSEKTIGCPIIISNEFEHAKTPHLNTEICKELIKADAVLVLSHVKGHLCCGFGGAIKNLGMGAVSTKTKADIHNLANPILVGECTLCETCVKACPVSAISVKSGNLIIDYDACWGCGVCINACPNNVLKQKIAPFDLLLAEAAFAAIGKMKKIYYINVLKNISRLCDCAVHNGPIVVKDIGYLASGDIIEIEKESLDLINNQAGKNLFFELHKKDPYSQINEIENLFRKVN